MTILTASLLLFALALALTYAGTRTALSRPYPVRGPAPAPDRPDGRTTASRALAMVAGMTMALAILAAGSAVRFGHLSLFALLLLIGAGAGAHSMVRDYLSGVPARAAWITLAAAAVTAWAVWPGWDTATAAAAVFTVQAIPALQFAWTFRSLAIAGLAIAFGYDAVQVWLTHAIQATTVHAGSWLPLLYTVPASWHWHAAAGMSLGAGDVLIPAILLTAAGRAALAAGQPGIFRAALAGYAAGLAAALAMVIFSVSVFPVTVFTIPAIVAATWLAARRHGAVPLLATTAGPAPAGDAR